MYLPLIVPFMPFCGFIFPSGVIFLLLKGFPLTFLMSNDDEFFQNFCVQNTFILPSVLKAVFTGYKNLSRQ